MLGLGDGQSLAAIRRLEQPVSLVPQERDQELAVGREVVNDQDGRRAQPPCEDRAQRSDERLGEIGLLL
jgi:hypothetical protein